VDDDMNENEKKSVWVVGGGFAGLAAAAALRQLPNVSHVTVLERCTEQQYYHTETAGAAVQLGPNGLRALKAIGGDALVARVLEEGEALTHIGIVLPNKDQTVMVIPDTSVQDTGLPQLLIRWGVLRRLLQELVPKDSIHTETGEEICGYAIVDNESDHLGVIPVDAQGKRVGPTDVPPPSLIVVAGTDAYSRLVWLLFHSVECY
jgi:2-polyprenyl-6-methoxyphenol hydroxylase-like FAD-dependent oxidoreductase